MADRTAIRPGSLRRRLTIAFLLVAGLSAAALAVASYAIVREARLSDSVDRSVEQSRFNLILANETLSESLGRKELALVAARIGADVPFFLEQGPQLGTGVGTSLSPFDLPQDYWVVLLLPDGQVKSSTADVYAAFDARGGEEGYAARREALLDALRGVRRPRDLAALPPNDLVSSPLAGRLREHGAFRADVTGAGPVALKTPAASGRSTHQRTSRQKSRAWSQLTYWRPSPAAPPR